MGNKNTLVSNSVLLELARNSLGKPMIKYSGIFQPCCQTIGSLKSLTVGVFTPLKLASVTNQGYFLPVPS